ncbi:mind superfamily p-loop atpase containing an inserted ferredoxin domain [hydrocarbon metagenome]|uniref:Mind superfamily p-loop atpase containing an inserted ferredoxin domain n=1 Tax=hydrocarbon metagenome TaxID=938273 RepID=A0A0W8E3W9_9ZZZZ
MEIAVASGKGGTGKTLVATCLARILADYDPVLIDADVEEPNAGLVIPHQNINNWPVFRPVPAIDMTSCTLCGKCAELCRFNALVVLPGEVMVFSELCHSCGLCAYICPENAINEVNHPIGVIEESDLLSGGHLITGRLIVGEVQSPPLIKAAREAKRQDSEYRVVDCPPGTTCPAIESIRDSDFCLLVTEPSLFGAHDLELSIAATKLLGISTGIIINRWQGDDGDVGIIAGEQDIPILERIPYSLELAKSYARGGNPLDALPELRVILEKIIDKVKERVV